LVAHTGFEPVLPP